MTHLPSGLPGQLQRRGNVVSTRENGTCLNCGYERYLLEVLRKRQEGNPQAPINMYMDICGNPNPGVCGSARMATHHTANMLLARHVPSLAALACQDSHRGDLVISGIAKGQLLLECDHRNISLRFDERGVPMHVVPGNPYFCKSTLSVPMRKLAKEDAEAVRQAVRMASRLEALQDSPPIDPVQYENESTATLPNPGRFVGHRNDRADGSATVGPPGRDPVDGRSPFNHTKYCVLSALRRLQADGSQMLFWYGQNGEQFEGTEAQANAALAASIVTVTGLSRDAVDKALRRSERCGYAKRVGHVSQPQGAVRAWRITSWGNSFLVWCERKMLPKWKHWFASRIEGGAGT